MLPAKVFHRATFYIGLAELFAAIFLAVFIPGAQFYTPFALGSWLVFDFIDYRLNRTSILSFFYTRKHAVVFFYFFAVAFIFCFIIDFVWGVRVLKLWEWVNYGPVQFIRMYLVMNISFVLGMYEIYRVVKTFLKRKIRDENLVRFSATNRQKRLAYVVMLVVGIVFLFAPVAAEILHIPGYEAYIMLFPFFSIILITNPLIFLMGDRPVLEEWLRLNKLQTASLAVTILLVFTVTEGLNIFGREWQYLKMPFAEAQILNVPVVVLIGWVPLVMGSISIVSLSRFLDRTVRIV